MIYILDGNVVALYKGDFNQKETYGGSPLNWARHFAKDGADRILISDLNARREKNFKQKQSVREIIEELNIEVMVEASFKTLESIDEVLKMGASQAVVSSPTLKFAKQVIDKFGAEKIVIQLFANRAELIEDKDRKSADDFTEVVEYAEKLVSIGAKYVLYKDKRSEGILTNPNYDEIDRLYLTCGKDLKIYSSGGISEVHHIKLLKKIGASGAVIGKALYERMLGIEEVKAAIKED